MQKTAGFFGTGLGGGTPGNPAVVVNRISTGNVGGTKLVDVNCALLADGAVAEVFSVGAQFQLVKAPTAAQLAAVDGITVVASTATAGAIWTRFLPSTSTRFAAAPPKFIDPAGSDDNDGLLVGTPIKTSDEWCRRMNGQTFTASAALAITCAAGVTGNFFGKLNAVQTDGGAVVIDFNAAKSVSAPGTVSSIVAQNIATQTEFQFTDSSGTGPVISADSRLRIVTSGTPSHVGGVGVVRGFGAGGATNPYTSAFVNSAGVEFFPSATDTYVVETLLTTIGANSLAVNATGRALMVCHWNDFLVEQAGLNGTAPTTNCVGDPSLLPTYRTSIFGPAAPCILGTDSVCFSGCEFKSIVNTRNSKKGTYTYQSCVWRAGFTSYGGMIELSGNCVIEGASEQAFGIIRDANALNLLMSRMGAVTGLILNADALGYIGGAIWTPPVGARNALTVGVVVGTKSVLSVTSFAASLASVSATTPISINGVSVTSEWFDETLGAWLVGTGGPVENMSGRAVAPAVSLANQMRQYFDTVVKQWLVSQNAGAFLPVAVVGSPSSASGTGQTATVGAGGFVQPAIGATVNVLVNSSAGFAVRDAVRVVTGGRYSVTAVPDSTHVTLQNTGSFINAAAAVVIAAGSLIRQIPSGGVIFASNIPGTYTVPLPSWVSTIDGALRYGSGGSGGGGGGGGGHSGVTGTGGGGGKGGGNGGAATKDPFWGIDVTAITSIDVVIGDGGAGGLGRNGGAPDNPGTVGDDGVAGQLTKINITGGADLIVRELTGGLGGSKGTGGGPGGAGGATVAGPAGSAGGVQGSSSGILVVAGAGGSNGGAGGGVGIKGVDAANVAAGGSIHFGANPTLGAQTGGIGGALAAGFGGGGGGGVGGNTGLAEEYNELGTAPPTTGAGSGLGGHSAGHGGDGGTNANLSAGADGQTASVGRGGGGGQGGGGSGAGNPAINGAKGGDGKKGSPGFAQVVILA